MKHEWRKHEKEYYQPDTKPQEIKIPPFRYFTIEGEGNPNDDHFPAYIQVLYSVSYALRMSPKKGNAPDGYYEYTVYPIEGVWDISEEAKRRANEKFTKDDFVFKLMIRQPDFLTSEFAEKIIEEVSTIKPHPLLEKVKFEIIEDGLVVQMMHLGSYDDEPASFRMMEEYAESVNLRRSSKKHREIYLNDARKTHPDKLKTVLRFKVEN